MNISLEEYTSMMGLYLSQLKDSTDGTASIPKLYTFNSGEQNETVLTVCRFRSSYFN